MSAYDDLALDRCHQDLVDLARLLGVNPDAPDVVVQFAAALVLAIPSLLSRVQAQSPTKSGRKRTWQAGLYDELYRDVNKTMADLNCLSTNAIKHLREDRNGRWWRHSQPSLEARYREARAHVRETTRDRITRLLVQQGTPLHA